MKEQVLRLWTVYKSPSDYPGSYAARLFEIDGDGPPRPTGSIVVSKSLEHLRDELIEMGLVSLARSPEDDPTIVEVWL